MIISFLSIIIHILYLHNYLNKLIPIIIQISHIIISISSHFSSIWFVIFIIDFINYKILIFSFSIDDYAWYGVID